MDQTLQFYDNVSKICNAHDIKKERDRNKETREEKITRKTNKNAA